MEKLTKEIEKIEKELVTMNEEFDENPTLNNMRRLRERETTLKLLKEALEIVKKSA